jgi:hypothetical protein
MRLRPRRRLIPRRRGATGGFLLVVLGAWGALIPFVGPYFDYQIGTTQTWDWTMDRFWLSVLPGAVVVLGGLLLIAATTRRSASFGSLLALAGGLWFVAGPTVSMLWNDGDLATGAALGDTGTRVLEWIGFFYGTGALITLLASYELGFLAALPVTGEAGVPAAIDERDRVAAPADERVAAPADERADAQPASSEQPTTSQPAARTEQPVRRRRRGLFRRPTARRS